MEEEEVKIKDQIAQLRDLLDGHEAEARKDAAIRTISLMRSGENVQELFSSMLRCVKTSDLQLKKLVYLYLVNYSSQEPEQAIMAVNTFIQDSQDASPIIRALAVRTMCRIRLPSVAENLILPLKKCIDDKDPYVRKSAALGVAKLYDVLPEIVENANLFEPLIMLLKDSNPLVVANAITAIFEINSHRTESILVLTAEAVIPLLAALNDTSEWIQIQILDAIARYIPESTNHAESLIDRLIPFLKNNNPAVVLGSFKCIYAFIEYDERDPAEIFTQILPPLLTLLSSAEPEISYVILRTISLFVLRHSKVLTKEISLFFCKYNDPPYVKMEKLDIIMAIVARSNAKLVLDELSEYCNDVDVAFVKKAINCIGQIALKFEQTAPRCVEVILKILKGKSDYAQEETVVVVSDILRKYPNRYESIIANVCTNIDQFKETSARAAAVWILGEYCDHIENIDLILDSFLDSFNDEQPVVQLELLSSFVKVFIYKPDETKDQLQFILNEASKESISPDVKNQALIYWRLLTQDVDSTKQAVIFPKDSVEHGGVKFEENVLSELLQNIGSISGVLHEVPATFLTQIKYSPEGDNDEDTRKWTKLHIHDDIDFIDLYVCYDPSFLHLRLVNRSSSPISDFAFAVNENLIGLLISGDAVFPKVLEEDESTEVQFPITIDHTRVANISNTELEFALQTNFGVVFANGRAPIEIACTEEGKITQQQFSSYYNSLSTEIQTTIEYADIAIDEELENRNVFVIGKNEGKTFVSLAIPCRLIFVGELYKDKTTLYISGYSNDPGFRAMIEASAGYLFTGQ